jgi:uncharacterized protein YrrD
MVPHPCVAREGRNMLRRVEKLYGFVIRAKDGHVGKVDDFYFDDEHWSVRYMVVNTGSWLSERRVLISPHALEPPLWEEEVLPVDLTREQVEKSPDIDLDKPVHLQQLAELHDHYGWPTFWGGSPMLGMATPSAYPMIWAEAEMGDQSTHPGERPPEQRRGDPHLRSAREVAGYHVEAKDGEIGHVEDFFVSDAEWCIRYILVNTRNWLPGRRVLVAPEWTERISWVESKIYLSHTREQVKGSPEYDPSRPISRDYESDLYLHYNWPGYWGA